MKTKRTYEDFLFFAENQLGIRFLEWQKDVLRKVYENKPLYYRPARGIGMTTLEKAVMLLEVFKEDEVSNEQNHSKQ